MDDVTRRQVLMVATAGTVTTAFLSGSSTRAEEGANQADQEIPDRYRKNHARSAAEGEMPRAYAANKHFIPYKHQELGHYTIKGELYCLKEETYTTGRLFGFWFLPKEFYLDRENPEVSFVANFGQHKVTVFLIQAPDWKVGFAQWHLDNQDQWVLDKAQFILGAACR